MLNHFLREEGKGGKLTAPSHSSKKLLSVALKFFFFCPRVFLVLVLRSLYSCICALSDDDCCLFN